ncbi:MAG TPA: FadR/GntR family transcriptional regulator [Steroidobacteraceae bacterium]|jgi:DNA-binding FadR family transcriptional regulator|nr:FadR/GntR family transcriptional regulator [Steroidobacteraceae bacterium]
MTSSKPRRPKKSSNPPRPRRPSTAKTHPRKHGIIAQDLGIAILSGEHAPGSFLPNEHEASDRLGTSRGAYREAMRILSAKGMVESRPRAGTRVTERRSWHFLDPDVLRWIFQSEPDRQFVRGIFELRRIVEPHAAELAARRRTSSQLARMGHALEEMAKHGLTTPEGRAADQIFHEEILTATENEALMALSATIGAAIDLTTIFKQKRHRVLRDALPEHREVYAAIADGDPERALKAARALIELAHDDIFISA